MASQYCNGEKEKWKLAGMCRLHRFEQNMSKRSFPHALDRLDNGCNSRPSSDELFGCLPGIPLNTTGSG